MLDWVRHTLDAPDLGWVALPAMLVLGMLACVTSCCTPAVLGVMAGYSGSGDRTSRRAVLSAGFSFVVGTTVALAALGAIAGVVGQIAWQALGVYFKVGTAFVAILFGLAVLEKLPFRLPSVRLGDRQVPKGTASAGVFGFFVGGASLTCMLCCNPLIAVPLGVAAINGETLLGAGMLGAFAVGYSLPLASVLVGLRAGLGKLQETSRHALAYVKTGAGILLIAAALYILATI